MRAISLILMLGWAQVLWADEGKRLHDSACLHCHSSLTDGQPLALYSRDDRKVKSLKGLSQRVSHCTLAADVTWSSTEQAVVVDYLNRTFYHF